MLEKKQNKKHNYTKHTMGIDNIGGKALLKNGKISPRKIGLMLEVIRGKKVKKANELLMAFAYKKSAMILNKLLKSAVANGIFNNKHRPEDIDNCFIQAWVGKGMVLKRIEPRARGSSNRLEKVYSHVWLYLTKERHNGKESKSISNET